MQLLEGKHLTLRLIRLIQPNAWLNQDPGFSFVLVKGGHGQYISASTAQALLPGDVLVLSSTETGKIVVASGEMVFWCFSACFENLSPLFSIGEICLLQNTIESFKGPKFHPAASTLAQECHRLVASAPPPGNIEHRSQVLRIAAAVLSAEFNNARSQRAGFVRLEDHIMQVLEGLSAAELLNLSVGDMAEKFNCSRRHLNRLFHQHFGCSVASLKMEMRLLNALTLLRDPDMKIIHVAEQCGFNQLGLFNTCFKKRFGDTPGQWRKSALNGENSVASSDIGNPTCPMRSHGLCPWKAEPDHYTAITQKISPCSKLIRPNGPADPKFRAIIMKNMQAGDAKPVGKAEPETKLHDRP